MSHRLICFTILVLFVSVACGRDGTLDVPVETVAPANSSDPGAIGLHAQAVDRRLILTGRVSIEIEALDSAMVALRELAQSVGGYVTGSEVRAPGARSGSLTLRVPAESFEDIRRRATALGRLMSSSSESVDVTREYVDLETRIQVKVTTVARLEDLLGRTGQLEDLLAVERELARVTSELETLRGELQYMSGQVSLATLVVMLAEPGAKLGRDTWRPVGDALGGAGRVFAESIGVAIYLIVAVGPWLLLAGVGWWLVRKLRDRTRVSSRGSATGSPDQ